MHPRGDWTCVHSKVRQRDAGDIALERRITGVIEAVARRVRIEADFVVAGGQCDCLTEYLMREVVDEVHPVITGGVRAAGDDGVVRDELSEAAVRVRGHGRYWKPTAARHRPAGEA